MNAGNLTKLLIKISHEDAAKWTHLCYIPEEIYNLYKENHAENLSDMNATLSRWALEDFNKTMAMTTLEEFEELKGLIRDFCKETYPDIYLEQSTDRQGWLRVWVTKKMKEDMEKDGK